MDPHPNPPPYTACRERSIPCRSIAYRPIAYRSIRYRPIPCASPRLQQDLPHAAIGRVAVGIERGERGEARRRRVAEQLADIVDLAVAVEIAREEGVVALHPGGALGEAVIVDVEMDVDIGPARELQAVAVEVEHQRGDCG